jgi:hypothetical protein
MGKGGKSSRKAWEKGGRSAEKGEKSCGKLPPITPLAFSASRHVAGGSMPLHGTLKYWPVKYEQTMTPF